MNFNHSEVFWFASGLFSYATKKLSDYNLGIKMLGLSLLVIASVLLGELNGYFFVTAV